MLHPELPGPNIVEGPARSSEEIGAFRLIGLQLGMPLDVAQRTLEEQGFSQRATNSQPVSDTSGKNLGHLAGYWGKRPADQPDSRSQESCSPPIGNLVHLGYVKLGNGNPVIASIRYRAPATCSALKNIDGKRQEIIDRFGNPTFWRKIVNSGGLIRDEISFSSSRELSDKKKYGEISSCLLNWQQQKLCHGIDCRKMLSGAGGAVMRIGYLGWETYELEDITAQYASLRRDPLFMKQDVAGNKCLPRLSE